MANSNYRFNDNNASTRYDDHKFVKAGKGSGFYISRENREEKSYLHDNVDKKCNTLLSMATTDDSNDTNTENNIVYNIKPVGFKEETLKQLESEKKAKLIQKAKAVKKERKIRKKKKPKKSK